MIHNEIYNALTPIGIPVVSLHYEGQAETYITFQQYDEQTLISADDEEYATVYYYQVNVFSKKDFADMVLQVKEAMKTINAYRTNETELYYDEYYQHSIRFKITRKMGDL